MADDSFQERTERATPRRREKAREEGKVANLIITDGDPLEIQTETKHLFIRGQLTPTTNKHLRLYEKYGPMVLRRCRPSH